jgi:hypothetical protein
MSLSTTLDTVCAPSEDVVTREIEGEIVIVPLAAGIGEAEDELYTLNETGRAIWQTLDGTRTLREVVEVLMQEYQGDREELEADVVGFAGELVRRRILTARG